MRRWYTVEIMSRLPWFAGLAVAGASGLLAGTASPLPAWLLWPVTVIGVGLAAHELAGKPIPFLRWSVIRMVLGRRTLLRSWQAGDGREEAAARYVLARAPAGDVEAALRAIDEYATMRKFLINVGDEKGALLDAAVRRVQPRRALELGAYVGYSALRIARLLPAGGHLTSVEWSAANAAIARRVIAHAGVADRVTVVEGFLADGGKTLAHLTEACGFARGGLDLVFVDHDKDAYLPDLRRILDAGWLHPGSVVVADNVGFPGAPAYRAYMQAEEGKRWHTEVHPAHAEYQSLIRDLVLESTLLG